VWGVLASGANSSAARQQQRQTAARLVHSMLSFSDYRHKAAYSWAAHSDNSSLLMRAGFPVPCSLQCFVTAHTPVAQLLLSRMLIIDVVH
jgi:hypothetical protein